MVNDGAQSVLLTAPIMLAFKEKLRVAIAADLNLNLIVADEPLQLQPAVGHWNDIWYQLREFANSLQEFSGMLGDPG